MKNPYSPISSAGISLFRGLLSWAPRLLTGAVGLILLFSGLLKATDINLFVIQVRDYEIISHNVLLIVTAWSVILAEFTLGMSLLVSFRTKWAIPLTAFLLLIFLGATAWAWFTGVTEDCGCFGNLIHRSPGEALIEDMVLMLALIPAWVEQRHSDKSENNLKLLVVIAACVTGLILPELFGSPISQINSYLDESDYTQQRFHKIQDIIQKDLEHEAHLLVVMSTDCQHCIESVEGFNIWTKETDFPHLTVLMPNNEDDINTFINKFLPEFPILQITEDEFWDLLELGSTPRIFLIHNGRIIKIWDEDVPDISKVREVLMQ